MKAKEAKELIGCILDWQFVLMGVKERSDIRPNSIDIKKYSLQDLIDANNKIKLCNKKARIAQEYYKKKNGTSKGVTQHMLCADRLLAAIYVCMNFQPDGELVAIYDMLGCGVVKVKS